jgi:peptide/nickel transport system ATP-binding protein
MLEVQDLTVRFGAAAAVDRISFSIAEGEMVALVGESGSGKTVTARAILRLLPSSASIGGAVRFLGRDLVALESHELREVRGAQVGMIFQEPMTALNPVLTVGYQIAEAVEAHRKVSRKERKAIAIEMMRRVGIPSPETRVHEYPHQLSGGLRQRAMIAMALAMGPKLLLADEPTTALDVTVRAQILALLDRLRRETGMAILFITHDLAVVAETCDRILVMYAGSIVEEGRVSDVLAAPRHPYTQGLLRSIPKEGERRLHPIPGAVPSIADRPAGCRFRPRCERAEDRCREEPQLVAVGDRKVACFFPVEGP